MLIAVVRTMNEATQEPIIIIEKPRGDINVDEVNTEIIDSNNVANNNQKNNTNIKCNKDDNNSQI